MILIGQFDSPFVRRVGIALRLYDLPFEHRPWSVWGDAERLAQYNPLQRVPVLVLDDGVALCDSHVILDQLDEQVGPARALLPRSGPARRTGLRAIALITGLGDRIVGLTREQVLSGRASDAVLTRTRPQIERTLDVLELERATIQTQYWLGDSLGHVDIALTSVLRFVREVHPELVAAARWPRLFALAEACEELTAFREICQPFS